MIRIILVGCLGRMGQMLMSLIQEDPELELVAGVDHEFASTEINLPCPVYETFSEVPSEIADGIVDFSSPQLWPDLLDYATREKLVVVSGTTGFSEADEFLLAEASQQIPVCHEKNFSQGITVMRSLAKKAAEALQDFDLEIVEAHHARKVDAPSGTAIALFDSLNEARGGSLTRLDGRSGMTGERPRDVVGVSSVRAGSIVGDHTVIFAGDDEVLEITHRASSRKIFALGALRALKFLADLEEPGRYSMDEILA